MAGCSLFVPLVRGSSVCSVCRKGMNEHAPASVFYLPTETIYGTLPGMRNKCSTMKNPSPLAPSIHSAFSTYKRQHSGGSTGTVSSCSNQSGTAPMHLPPPSPSTTFIPLPDNILRPQPIHSGSRSEHTSLSPSPRGSLYLPQEDHSDACIYRKIRGKEKFKERSSSVGEIRTDISPIRTPSPSLKELPRANNFKQLLTRFQSADRITHRAPRRFTVDNNGIMMTPSRTSVTSPTRCANGVSSRPPSRTKSQQNRPPPCESIPIRRGSTPRQNPSGVSSREYSPVSRSNSSRHSHYEPGAMVYTRESSYHASPVSFGRDPSPLSHTGSTPPGSEAEGTVQKGPPLTITIPTPKTRRSLPNRWIKETDIDDPASLPVSPICALTPDHTPPSATPSPPRSAPVFDHPIENVKFRSEQNGKPGARRVFSDLDDSKRSTPISISKRTVSRDDRSPLSPSFSSPLREQIASRSSICTTIPIQLEHLKGRGTPEATRIKDIENQYQQMTLSHVNTLAHVADRLSDTLRARDEPLSRNRMEQLDFKDFVLKSSNPVLVKGTSLFYDAILPRPGQSDFDVTIMVAPSSQYAPLLRRGGECGVFGVPSLVEMEDHEGSVGKFLRDTGRSAAARNPRIVVMPRLNLCSFHSLAAQNLHQTTAAENHEIHVSFIMIQLLAALKYLQSDGVENLSNNFKEFLLAYRYTTFQERLTELEEYPRLLFLPETLGADLEDTESESVGLCRYALRALCTLLHYKMDGRAPNVRNRSRYSRALLACARELEMDKSCSLTRAKNLLELSFWAPGEVFEGEYQAKLWLDMKRSECVNQVLRTLIDDLSSSSDMQHRFQMEFLLAANPRSLQQSHHTLNNTHF